jgi:hypothetical protein
MTPAVLALLLVASASASTPAPPISLGEFAQAVNDVDGRSFSPPRSGRLSAENVRIVSCSGPEEEPTEFECVWQEQVRDGWIQRRTRLAVDGPRWRIID